MSASCSLRHRDCVKYLTKFLLHILHSCTHHVEGAFLFFIFMFAVSQNNTFQFEPKKHQQKITTAFPSIIFYLSSHASSRLNRVSQISFSPATLSTSSWGISSLAFPDQIRCIVSPLGSGSTPWFPVGWACPENLPREAPRRLPEQQGCFSELPLDIGARHVR